MDGQGMNKNNGGDSDIKPSTKMKSKAKGYHNKTRFQLFDPSSKSALINLFDESVVQLHLEDDSEKKNEEENDNSASLNFDGGSSDEDVIENLPHDGVDLSNPKKNTESAKPSVLFCGSCGVKFEDIPEQRQHYTLDWHRYNVKRKLNGQAFVTEPKFNEMIDDLSSIDGSDTEEEDSQSVTTTTTQQVERLLEKLNTDSKQQIDILKRQVPLSRSQKLEKSPKNYFENSKGQIITCYKAILSHSSLNQDGINHVVGCKFSNLIRHPLRITIVMASGGHFAAAVFEGNSCTHHKTFHSYTVRAKQGGTQGSYDARSATSHAKSAGASLRRYNQQSFTQHIQDLLTSWKTSISDSDLVFYKAVSANANVLFLGKNPPLSKDDKNIRTIPFPTKRPTFSEVKRVHSLLTTIHLYDSFDLFLAAHSHFVKNVSPKDKTSKPKNKKTINRAKSRSPKRKDELEELPENDESDTEEVSCPLEEVSQVVDLNELKEYDDSLTPDQRNRGRKKKSKKQTTVFVLEGILKDLSTTLQQKDYGSFKTLLSKLKEVGQSEIINHPIDVQTSTLLHLAAKTNQLDVVWNLLENGCDPAIKDKLGKYAYNYADTRECRDTFRKFMGEFPDKYDYKKGQVPPPLSEDMEKERAEKKKLLNKMKREKEKQKKIEKKEKESETEEQRRFLNLSDREKRALAAEQRILAQCKKNAEKAPILVRCFECATDISGKVPFEYNQNVFCTTKCLALHRKKFPCPLSV